MNDERIKGNSQSLAKRDIAWGVLAANLFLIGMITTLLLSIRGFSVWLPDFFGGLLGVLGMAAIPVAIAYIFSRDKKSFRFRLWLTVCAWISVFFMIYGAIRQ
ncbi:MAG: hypothetical protein H5U26_08440 [Immundisolibacter sp.]|uniref:hypothetical protein n=1 Tax=Immundisolibacter sp. TaxID=1934948 RepID=UPI001984882E|nr:hypothetical protein [Immundisolibacter sp.]MBC7162121.1 hypothetical protein [Immundisolibacter sp.]